ncbi:hypothetical protein C0Q16_29320, partial [Klebsiella pneumoniae]
SARCFEHRAAVAIDQATERSRIWRTLSEIMVGQTELERMQTHDRCASARCFEHRAAVAIDQATERSRIWRTLSEIMVG